MGTHAGGALTCLEIGLNKMLLVLVVLVLLLGGWAYLKSPALAYKGASDSVRLMLNILPMIVVGFFLGGMISVLLPRELVVAWAGEGSGLRGLLVGTIAGAFAPGGPYIQFPVVAGIWKAGAGVGPMTAYVSAWALIAVHRIVIYEGPILVLALYRGPAAGEPRAPSVHRLRRRAGVPAPA